MAQTWVTINQATQSVTTILGNLDDKAATLQSCFSGTSAPSSPVSGMLWRDTSGTPDVLKVYDGSDWYPVATLGEEWQADAEVSFQQLKEARVENLASDEAVAAGKDGALFYHTGQGVLKYVDNGVEAAVRQAGALIRGTSLDEVVIPLDDTMKDASNPPTLGTKGTTPTIRGLLFDAANELFLLRFRVPDNWSGDADLTVRLACVLNQAEDANDDIDWSGDLVSVADGESVSGTSTAIAASTTDIGANNAEGDLIVCDLTIDYDDADNPISRGDTVCLQIHRTDLAEVGGVILVWASLLYTAQHEVQGAIS